MKALPFYAFILLYAGNLNAQLPVKYDDQYQTIYARQLCQLAAENHGLVLIDVRSPGEFSDTSQYASLNLGHLKGAINLAIDSIRNNPSLLEPYRDKTIVFYCSHSQRSRRVSKLMSENGFTHFYNLNGGMSHITQLSEKEFPCRKEWIISNLPFQNLSLAESANMILHDRNLVIVDVRPASYFSSRDSLIENNIGRIRSAINIPYATFKQRITELDKYRNQPVLLYSSSGDGDAARAASELVNRGFGKVYQLLGGIDDLIASREDISFIENPTPFHLINSPRMLSLLKNTPGLTIYDTRPEKEYNNQITGMESYKNLGHVKNAIRLEEKDFPGFKFPENKKAPILIYGHAEAYRLASLLANKGYTEVSLHPGLYDFIWSAFNVEECRDDLKYLEDHEGLY